MPLKLIYNSVLDLFFPRQCVGCGKYDVWTCDQCLARSKEPQFLTLDNAPLQAILAYGNYHDSFLRAAIRQMKFHHIKAIAQCLGQQLATVLAANPSCRTALVDCAVIPISLHSKRLRERGFNQSAIIAQEIAKKFHWPLVDDLLIRAKHSASQTTVARAKRVANVADVFTLNPQTTFAPHARSNHLTPNKHCTPASTAKPTFLLVDDVITTGATIIAAAQTIQKQIPATIYAAAIACGQ